MGAKGQTKPLVEAVSQETVVQTRSGDSALYERYKARQIIAIDAGNGFTEVATPQGMLSGHATALDMRTVWAPVSLDHAMVAGVGGDMLIGAVNEGPLFAYGMSARAVAPRNMVVHARGSERYEADEYRHLVWCVIAAYLADHFENNTVFKPIVAHGLPGGVWRNIQMRRAARQKLAGHWIVRLEAPSRAVVEFEITDAPHTLISLPEPLCAFNDMCYDSNGTANNTLMGLHVFMWDIGSQTTDRAIIRQGKPSVDTIDPIKWGVHIVAERALDAYHAARGNGCSIEEVDLSLESGEIYDPRTGRMINLVDARDKAFREICHAMLDAMSTLRDQQVFYNLVVIGGGGAQMLLDAVKADDALHSATEHWQLVSNPRRGVVEGMLKSTLKALRAIEGKEN